MALSAGDIAFVQYNSDGDDEFAFVVLSDIGPGEEINFTDIGWQGAGFSGNSESTLTWDSGAGVAAGTVITINGTTATGGGSVTSGSALLLSASGDTIIAYQGSSGSPTPIAQINANNTFNYTGDSTETNLATGLTLGDEALHMYQGAERDNGVYTGPTTGDQATLLAAINDPSNWSLSNTAIQDFTGSFTVTCFCVGTQIGTPDGVAKVEDLKIGDLIRTYDGRDVPVKWIGRQTVSSRFGPAERLRPVRFTAGSLGNDLPHSDLTVTADHAMLVDGVLCTAGTLVNGMTITHVPLAEMGERFTVYHIETEAHDIILANGAASETYIDHASRRVFDNFAEYEALYGDETEVSELAYPRVTSARQLPAGVLAQLAEGIKQAG